MEKNKIRCENLSYLLRQKEYKLSWVNRVFVLVISGKREALLTNFHICVDRVKQKQTYLIDQVE